MNTIAAGAHADPNWLSVASTSFDELFGVTHRAEHSLPIICGSFHRTLLIICVVWLHWWRWKIKGEREGRILCGREVAWWNEACDIAIIWFQTLELLLIPLFYCTFRRLCYFILPFASIYFKYQPTCSTEKNGDKWAGLHERRQWRTK